MGRSIGKLLSGFNTEKASSPLTKSLLTGIKRGINFFVVTEEDLAQAGVYLGYFHADKIEHPGSTFDDSNESNQAG
jgi:hypothetical protein